jgi:hypothetical protein
MPRPTSATVGNELGLAKPGPSGGESIHQLGISPSGVRLALADMPQYRTSIHRWPAHVPLDEDGRPLPDPRFFLGREWVRDIDVCAALNLTTVRLKALIDGGHLPRFEHGRRVYFRSEDVRAILLSGRSDLDRDIGERFLRECDARVALGRDGHRLLQLTCTGFIRVLRPDLFPGGGRYCAVDVEQVVLAYDPEGPYFSNQDAHLYAAEVVGAGTKIGISATPTSRIAHHALAARSYGREIGRVWVSVRHAEARENEKVLKRHPSAKSGTEYLDLPFEEVVALIQPLPFNALASYRWWPETAHIPKHMRRYIRRQIEVTP